MALIHFTASSLLVFEMSSVKTQMKNCSLSSMFSNGPINWIFGHISYQAPIFLLPMTFPGVQVMCQCRLHSQLHLQRRRKHWRDSLLPHFSLGLCLDCFVDRYLHYLPPSMQDGQFFEILNEFKRTLLKLLSFLSMHDSKCLFRFLSVVNCLRQNLQGNIENSSRSSLSMDILFLCFFTNFLGLFRSNFEGVQQDFFVFKFDVEFYGKFWGATQTGLLSELSLTFIQKLKEVWEDESLLFFLFSLANCIFIFPMGICYLFQ